jgi:hypothetical protein
VGPNPSVSLLDLLLLTSLQAWSFEAHWIPAGIGAAGARALDRLKRAEEDAWISSNEVLSEDQLITLRELISAWIFENPDRTVVALVRFNEFNDCTTDKTHPQISQIGMICLGRLFEYAPVKQQNRILLLDNPAIMMHINV